MRLNKIKLAVFDMDGIVFDSERVYFEKWQQVCKKFGYEMDEAIHKGLMGTNAITEREYLLNVYGGDCPAEKIREERVKMIYEHANTYGMPIKPGFFELMSALKQKNIPAVLATSSERKRAMLYLEKAGITDRFMQITCGDEAKKGKPSPEIFLLAAKKADIAPEDCAVFEDSENGIIAAHAANMLPVFVRDIFPASQNVKNLSGYVLESLSEAAEIIGG